MPVITIDGPKLTKEQKAKLIKGFTQVASETLNIPTQSFIVLLKETDPDNVGVGGEMLSEKHK